MGEAVTANEGLSIALSATADMDTREFIRRQLRAFNDTRSEHHRAIRARNRHRWTSSSKTRRAESWAV